MNLYILKKISNPSNPNYSTCEVFKFPQSKGSPNSCTACLLLQHLSLYSAHLFNSSSLLKYIMEKTQKNCKEKIHQQKQSTLVMQQSTTALYRSRTQRISPPLPTNDHTVVKLKKSNSLSEKELKLAAISISLNVRLRTSDMPVSMQEHALRYARSLVGSTSAAPPPQRLTPTLLARSLKKEFDGLYGPAWHCVVGKSFGSFVTHSAGGFVYFSLDSLSFLLFKTEVQLVKDSPLPAPPPRHL